MGNGETKKVGNATVTKQVIRTVIAERDSAGTRIGRRSFSSTSYIVKNNGRVVDVVRSLAAAMALAGAQ